MREQTDLNSIKESGVNSGGSINLACGLFLKEFAVKSSRGNAAGI